MKVKNNKYMKLLLKVAIVALLGSISFLLFEPLKDYLCNPIDYWFSLDEYIKLVLEATVLAALSLIITGALLAIFFPRIISKVCQVFFIIILGLYIQSNFIPNTNGVLDGSPVDWTRINPDMILSDILWVAIIVIIALVLKKVDSDKIDKVIFVVSFLVLLLEIVTITSLAITNYSKDREKEVYMVSDDQEMVLSCKTNFVILMLDRFDSAYFIEALSDDLKSELDGFTFYPDTSSIYGHTMCSVAQILTGDKFLNQSSYSEYEDKAFANSHLINKLTEEEWNIGLYSDYHFPRMSSLDGCVNLKRNISKISSKRRFYKPIYQIVAYSIAPYHLKKLFWFYPNLDALNDSPDNMNCSWYSLDNELFYNNINNISATDGPNAFRLYHINGMHFPYKTSADVVTCEEDVPFEDTREANYKIISKFINTLKEQDLYDNSIIMIMADHGGDRPNGRQQNPLFMVKGLNENHAFTISDLSFTYDDIDRLYDALLDGVQGETAIPNHEGNRYFYHYGSAGEYHMTEYIFKGKAYENELLVPTGKLLEYEK